MQYGPKECQPSAQGQNGRTPRATLGVTRTWQTPGDSFTRMRNKRNRVSVYHLPYFLYYSIHLLILLTIVHSTLDNNFFYFELRVHEDKTAACPTNTFY